MTKKGNPVAILGALAAISIVGIVMMLQGSTGNVTYWPVTNLEPSAEKACSVVDCNYGQGGIPIGEEGNFWLCACPNQFSDRTIADWGTKTATGARDFPNMDNVWRVSKQRTY